jgi:hypothetical protein
MAVDRRGDKLPGFGGMAGQDDHDHRAIRARRIERPAWPDFGG